MGKLLALKLAKRNTLILCTTILPINRFHQTSLPLALEGGLDGYAIYRYLECRRHPYRIPGGFIYLASLSWGWSRKNWRFDVAASCRLLNLISMVTLMVGVSILPILDLADLNFAQHSFGLAVILFVGYPFALAGHYDLYNSKTSHSYSYFPFQEKVVVLIIIILVVGYLLLSIT